MGIEALENQAGILRIVLDLYEDGRGISELKSRLNLSQSAVYNSLRRLKDLRWVTEEVQESFPFKREVFLSVRGQKAAAVLRELEGFT